jgi:hypothetical protein
MKDGMGWIVCNNIIEMHFENEWFRDENFLLFNTLNQKGYDSSESLRQS